MKNDKKKEMSSKMYSQHRCGKCNRFGHHHDKCTKDKTGLPKDHVSISNTKEQLASKLDSFISKNKGAGKQTNLLDTVFKSHTKEMGKPISQQKNYMFEEPSKTIKRIREGGYDSRYGN